MSRELGRQQIQSTIDLLNAYCSEVGEYLEALEEIKARVSEEIERASQECHCDIDEPETPNSHARYSVCAMHKAGG